MKNTIREESKQMKKKWLSVVLAFTLSVGLVPTHVVKAQEAQNSEAVENTDLSETQIDNTQNSKQNVLDGITSEVLFEAIKGENSSSDNVTKPFITPKGTNYISDFYAILDVEGKVSKWSGGAYKAKAEVMLKSISDPSLLKLNEDENQIEILKQPEKDTRVNLVFSVEEVRNSSNKKDVTISIILKAQKTNVLDGITSEVLFEAIKGENSSSDNVTKPLITPQGTNYISDFYAILDEEGKVSKWSGGAYKAKAEVILKSISDPSLLKLNEDENQIEILKTPEKDTKVSVIFEVSEVKNEKNKKDVVVDVIVKQKSGESQGENQTQKELQTALDTYFVPENITYSTIKKENIAFEPDYLNGNVRYDFILPNVANLAGYAWNEVKTTIVSKTPNALEFPYKYTARPIRADVGDDKKTATISYTLEKDGIEATKDLVVEIPALSQKEIDEELAVLELVKNNFFEGIQYKNYDRDNVTTDLQMFQEVNYTGTLKDGFKLNWVENAKDKSYYGFALPTNQAFDVVYPEGGQSIFSATNLVLEQRPETDTHVVIRNKISSIQLGRYAALYKDNKDLQKLVDVPVEANIVVKAVNAGIKTIKIGEKIVTVKPEETETSYLLDQTLETLPVEISLYNQGAKLVVNGTDWGRSHRQNIELEDGFCKLAIKVSDEDHKQEGSLKESAYTISVVSKPYLEGEIEKLPQVSHASKEQLELAQKLLVQYEVLSVADKKSIKNHERLEEYKNGIENPDMLYQEQLKLVQEHLMEGIRGENPNADTVYTDMQEIYFARLTEEGIVWSKEADHSDVEIVWKSSSAPEYINVHDSNDFGGRYVKAFCVNQRPAAGENDLKITFTATLRHLKNPSVEQEISVPFTLKAYNASMDEIKIEQIPEFKIEPGKLEYQVFYQPEIENAVLHLKTIIPGAQITVNGEKIKDGTYVLEKLPGTVTIQVNDEIKNTLNEKWDEKIYKIEFLEKKPEIPNKPIEPEKPETPDKPIEPENPETPNKPVEPETPDKPVEPEKPETPDKPAKPEKPETPNKPVKPEKPNKPDKSETKTPKTSDTNRISFYSIMMVCGAFLLMILRRKGTKNR